MWNNNWHVEKLNNCFGLYYWKQRNWNKNHQFDKKPNKKIINWGNKQSLTHKENGLWVKVRVNKRER